MRMEFGSRVSGRVRFPRKHFVNGLAAWMLMFIFINALNFGFLFCQYFTDGKVILRNSERGFFQRSEGHTSTWFRFGFKLWLEK